MGNILPWLFPERSIKNVDASTYFYIKFLSQFYRNSDTGKFRHGHIFIMRAMEALFQAHGKTEKREGLDDPRAKILLSAVLSLLLFKK